MRVDPLLRHVAKTKRLPTTTTVGGDRDLMASGSSRTGGDFFLCRTLDLKFLLSNDVQIDHDMNWASMISDLEIFPVV